MFIAVVTTVLYGYCFVCWTPQTRWLWQTSRSTDMKGYLCLPAAYLPGQGACRVHWSAGWMGPTAVLGVLKEKSYLCRKSNPPPPFVHPEVNHITDWTIPLQWLKIADMGKILYNYFYSTQFVAFCPVYCYLRTLLWEVCRRELCRSCFLWRWGTIRRDKALPLSWSCLIGPRTP